MKTATIYTVIGLVVLAGLVIAAPQVTYLKTYYTNAFFAGLTTTQIKNNLEPVLHSVEYNDRERYATVYWYITRAEPENSTHVKTVRLPVSGTVTYDSWTECRNRKDLSVGNLLNNSQTQCWNALVDRNTLYTPQLTFDDPLTLNINESTYGTPIAPAKYQAIQQVNAHIAYMKQLQATIARPDIPNTLPSTITNSEVTG